MFFSLWSDSCAAFLLCSVCVCAANGQCLAVIYLCSLCLDCQVMSTEAYNLVLISHCFAPHKMSAREQQANADININFSSIQNTQ